MSEGLTLDQYQDKARTTAIYGDSIDKMSLEQCRAALRLAYAALGLAGEAGEVANKAKKVIRDHQGDAPAQFKMELLKEVGGVQWYAADVCSHFGVPLSAVAQGNLTILDDRKNRGVLKGSGDNR